MSLKGSISKKDSSKKNEKSPSVPLNKFYEIPFLDRPLSTIMSILRYMKFIREEKADTEIGMYYTPKEKYPFDPLSQKQIEVFGGTFEIVDNVNALIKLNPICVKSAVTYNYYPQIIEPKMYSAPIGPLSFLNSTVPYKPKKEDLDFLDYFSRK
jgi:hypothetical protein